MRNFLGRKFTHAHSDEETGAKVQGQDRLARCLGSPHTDLLADDMRQIYPAFDAIGQWIWDTHLLATAADPKAAIWPQQNQPASTPAVASTTSMH